jgi:hypothetical protein
VYLRIIFLIEVLVGLCAFGVLAYLSLSQVTIESVVSSVIKPSPWDCQCLAPKNGMIGYDGTKSEAFHYSIALRNSRECEGNLTQLTHNCSSALLSKEILSVYGYNTSRVICYAFYHDGSALCAAGVTDSVSAANIFGMVDFSPPDSVKKSFPNYASYPSVARGTFLRR